MIELISHSHVDIEVAVDVDVDVDVDVNVDAKTRKGPHIEKLDNQAGPPRPSDAISIEPNGTPNRPNREIFLKYGIAAILVAS